MVQMSAHTIPSHHEAEQKATTYQIFLTQIQDNHVLTLKVGEKHHLAFR
jgi:hypothetical protein